MSNEATRDGSPMMPLAQHRAADLVAFGNLGARTAADLLRDTALLAQQLPRPSEGSEVLLVFRHDRYAFAAALLASWSAGHAVALPPNTRRESIWKVADQPQVRAILHDTEAGGGICVVEALAAGQGKLTALTTPGMPDREQILTLYTSGSTQQPRAFPKTQGQLLGEALALARAFEVWGAASAEDQARIVGSVPPGHIYGLLFTVLMPLVAGAAFLRETLLHAQAIAQRIAEFRASVLVTVPAHLRGFGAIDPAELQSLRRVFSSTAALPEHTARAFMSQHGRRVTEIFGSTETGGIAWRDRAVETAWRPLPGVTLDVAPDGLLLVDSPFADEQGGRPYRTQDLAQLRPDQTFLHLGRADGVVKVGGLRVSLPAMEAAIGQLEGVEDVSVLGLPEASARGTQILAAIVAPGWTNARLRDALAESFDHSCLPRRIVFVDELPREESGKLQRSRLLRLFGLAPDGVPLQWSLDWGDESTSTDDAGAQRHVFKMHVPSHYGWFDGHFPEYPILAAAVQLRDVVLRCVRRARPDLGDVRQMTRLKFLTRIKPDDAIDVELSWKAREAAVQFALVRAGQICSSGSIAFAPGAP